MVRADISHILLMKQQVVVTHTVCQIKIHITRQLEYGYTFCQNVLSTNNRYTKLKLINKLYNVPKFIY